MATWNFFREEASHARSKNGWQIEEGKEVH